MKNLTCKEYRLLNLKLELGKWEQSGRSQTEFAVECGISPTHLSQLLSGYRGIGDAVARRIEKALGLENGLMDNPPNAGGGILASPPNQPDDAKILAKKVDELSQKCSQLSAVIIAMANVMSSQKAGSLLAESVDATGRDFDHRDFLDLIIDVSSSAQEIPPKARGRYLSFLASGRGARNGGA